MTDIAIQSRKPFPLQVQHQTDEPAHALLIRTIAHNGSSLFGPVLRRCGVPSNHTVGKVDQQLVAHLCGADIDQLRYASADKSTEQVIVLGQNIRPEFFSDMWRRWCPACLQEAPYHRSWWDVTAVTACPIHGVELVDRCGCHKPLRHGEHSMTHCKMAHDFRLVPTVVVAPEGMPVDDYVVQRLLGTGEHPHALLDSTTLGRALQMMERIGRIILAEKSTIHVARTQVGVRELMTAGYRTLENFPISFDQYLDELVSRRDEKDRTSTLRTYGKFLHWLNSGSVGDDCPLATAIKRAVEQHAAKNMIDPRRILVDGAPAIGVLASAVASQIGVNVETLIRLSRATGYQVIEDHPLGNMIPPDQVEPFIARYLDLQSMEQIMAVLGVRRAVAIELADMGHLPFVCRPYSRMTPARGKRGQKSALRRRDGLWNSWYFEPGVADTFLGRLRALIKVDASIPTQDMVDMYWPTRMFATRADVLNMVLDGTLPLRGIDPKRTGMRSFLVSRSEAQKVMKLSRREGYPLREAAPMMGLSYHQLLSCVTNKLVAPAGTGTKLSVTEATLEKFKADYIRTNELASLLGTNGPRVVIRHLRENGVLPIETEGEIALTLYRRDEAMRVVVEAPKPMTFKNGTERVRHQKAMGLAVAPTFQRYENPPNWNKRSNDRSGRSRAGSVSN